jgi:4'-phosphopantetheinyl transferase
MISDWQAPPDRPELGAGEIHVWRFSLEQPQDRVDDFFGMLSPEERARAERGLLERVRRQAIVGRGFLRRTIARYLDRDPSSLSFTFNNYGKPALPESGLSFNLTHSDGRGLLAVTRIGELGVDLERVRPMQDLEAIARRFFAPGEVEVLVSVEESLRELAFFQCWTRKEAFIKALGEGLARPLDQFEVSLRPGEPARLVWVKDAENEPAGWRFHHLTPWPEYVGCVAIPAQDWVIRSWEG